MAHGIVLFGSADAENAVDDFISQARTAHEVGIGSVWVAQQFGHDAISLAGLIGAAVPGLGVGTAAVPFNPRHPLSLASQALTAQAAAHGNFNLGLALGGHSLEREAYGIGSENLVTRLREYLTVLRSIFETGNVDFHGTEYTASPAIPPQLAGGTPIPLYVAALGPKALQVAGELADGTLPYLAGPRTIGEFIAPTIVKAAADAGRPAPRVIAFVPVRLTEDVAAGRAEAEEQLAFYTKFPSYQRVIAREGVDSLADLAAIGDAEVIRRTVASYLDAGATDIVFSPVGRSSPDEELWKVIGSL